MRRDPLQAELWSSSTINILSPYNYVEANPINRIDPLGLNACSAGTLTKVDCEICCDRRQTVESFSIAALAALCIAGVGETGVGIAACIAGAAEATRKSMLEHNDCYADCKDKEDERCEEERRRGEERRRRIKR